MGSKVFGTCLLAFQEVAKDKDGSGFVGCSSGFYWVVGRGFGKEHKRGLAGLCWVRAFLLTRLEEDQPRQKQLASSQGIAPTMSQHLAGS